MKTILHISLLLISAVLFSCAGSGKLLKELNRKEPVHLNGEYQPENNRYGGYDYYFYLDKGDKIPVDVKMETAYLTVSEKQLNLVVIKKMYFFIRIPVKISDLGKLKMSDKEKGELFKKLIIYLSPDGKNWASYREYGSLKEVFGIKGGSISVGMGVSKKTGIKGNLKVIMK